MPPLRLCLIFKLGMKIHRKEADTASQRLMHGVSANL